VIVCGDSDALVGVFVSEQVPRLRVQVPPEEKVPEPVAVKETVSPLVEPCAPVTVTVRVEGVSRVTGLVQVSSLVTADEEEIEVIVVVDEAAGFMASTITPKSLPCAVPNARVAADIELVSTSYWAYTSCPALVVCISVIPVPAVWSLPPVSPPIWNTKEPAGAETTVLQGLEHSRLACDSGKPETKGLAVFAPETANAIMPYHVSPASVVVTEILSAERAEMETAYHVWTN
jgi:hypothetical protein